MRQAGQDPEQIHFRDILLRLRNAEVTIDDWKHIMKQTPTQVQDLSPFANALHLYPTVEAVVEHNVAKLRDSGKPVATIKAVHTGVNASKAPADDASGLEAVICFAKSARVMLISNLWVDVGLVNGAMGTIEAICYRSDGPPDLPLAVMVHFDKYSGPHTSRWNSSYHTYPSYLVQFRCSVFPLTATSQASLGCHYPQVPRTHPGHSCH